MSGITKAWYTVANVAVSGGTNAEYKAAMAFAFKQALTGQLTSVNLGAVSVSMGALAATVAFSSNSVSAGGADNIASASDVVFDAAGNPHSWIVFRIADFYAPADDLEFLIDFRSTNGGLAYISYSRLGYAGGSITNAPTAADEIVLKQGTTTAGTAETSDCWDGESTLSTNGVLHLQVSADGTTYRWFLARAGGVHTYGGFMRNHLVPASGMTNPALVWHLSADVDTDVLTWTVLQGILPFYFQDNGGVVRRAQVCNVVFGAGNTSLTTQTASPYDGSRYLPKIPIWASTPGAPISELPDQWWASAADPSGSKGPVAGELYAQVGDQMIAWPLDLPFDAT